MKKLFSTVFILVIIAAGGVFIVRTFIRSSQSPQVASPPDLTRTAARVYGKIEPAGREVFVASPVTRRVVRIYVHEGDALRQGQILLSLESDIERARLQVALAKVDSLRQTMAIDQDILKRRQSLFSQDAETEYAYTQAKLQVDLGQSNLALAEREVELARAELDQLELRAPVSGILYKFDIRLGESLASDDTSKITMGSGDLCVRLSVEAFWKDRVQLGDRCQVYDSETNTLIGRGEVVAKSPYLGRRNFRTEDDQERFDTKYMDVILKLEKSGADAPLGLSVVAVLELPATPEKK